MKCFLLWFIFLLESSQSFSARSRSISFPPRSGRSLSNRYLDFTLIWIIVEISFLIDKFTIFERLYFIHRNIFVSIFFALSLKFSSIFFNLLMMFTPKRVKFFAYLNASSFVVGSRLSSFVPILITLVFRLSPALRFHWIPQRFF